MKLCLYFTVLVVVLTSGCAPKKRESTALEPKAATQYQFAYDSYAQGDLIPALAAALKAVELSPDNPDARNLLGLIYFRQAKFAQAEEQFKQALDIDSKLSEGWNNLGTLYLEQKRYQEAHAALERALENPLYLYPERIYNNLGLVEEALGEKQKAIQAYERSISLSKDFYLPFQNLGKLLYHAGSHDRAAELLEEAARLCEDCSEPRYYLGMTLLKGQKMEAALKIFKQGAQVDPRGYYGQLCKKYLVKE